MYSSGPLHTFLLLCWHFKLFQSIFLATPCNLICMTDELALVHQSVVDGKIYKGGQTPLCSGSNMFLNTAFEGSPPVKCSTISSFIMWCLYKMALKCPLLLSEPDLQCLWEFELWEGWKIQLPYFFTGRFDESGRNAFKLGNNCKGRNS